jgi:hypothetical protein
MVTYEISDHAHAISARMALRMAMAYVTERRMRIIWQERAADYRECLVDRMRARQGWTLAERVAGNRAK